MISVLLTAYNAERYIAQAIDSIIAQTYDDWELLIIEDGSKDNTNKIIMDYQLLWANEKTPRIMVFHNGENIGHTKSLNKALIGIEGDYIAWHDADDVSHPKRFERQVQALSKYGLCTTHSITVSEKGKRVKNPYSDKYQRNKKTTVHDMLRHDCWLCLPSLMFKREIVDKIGGFDPECYYSQDLNFFLRALKAGYDFCIIPEELFKFRKHSKNVRSSGKFMDRDWHKFSISQAKKHPIILLK